MTSVQPLFQLHVKVFGRHDFHVIFSLKISDPADEVISSTSDWSVNVTCKNSNQSTARGVQDVRFDFKSARQELYASILHYLLC